MYAHTHWYILHECPLACCRLFITFLEPSITLWHSLALTPVLGRIGRVDLNRLVWWHRFPWANCLIFLNRSRSELCWKLNFIQVYSFQTQFWCVLGTRLHPSKLNCHRWWIETGWVHTQEYFWTAHNNKENAWMIQGITFKLKISVLFVKHGGGCSTMFETI